MTNGNAFPLLSLTAWLSCRLPSVLPKAPKVHFLKGPYLHSQRLLSLFPKAPVPVPNGSQPCFQWLLSLFPKAPTHIPKGSCPCSQKLLTTFPKVPIPVLNGSCPRPLCLQLTRPTAPSQHHVPSPAPHAEGRKQPSALQTPARRNVFTS